MNKKWIISISISLLIWTSGSIGYFYLKDRVANQVYAESPILKRDTDVPTLKTEVNLKEIIRETQKKVVMVELDDGTVGSGFLYNNNGDIITNAHVVSGATDVKIRTTDAKGYEGKVIGLSMETDIAVVRVEGLKDQPPLEISVNRKLEIGDEILALGSPLGLQNTVTTGIISGTDRELDIAPYKYENVYQISAPIAPGNSGGPLIDRQTGHVIGINSARLEQGSIGFSIPINTVLPLVNSWSETPMKNLPDISKLDGADEIDENKVLETADYLVSYFNESLTYRDYVTAYSMLGSDWQSKVSYEEFRNQYLNTLSLKIEELKINSQNGHVDVETVITAQERENEKKIQSTYRIHYEIAFENEQARIISEKKELLK
ncbi:S1C family serine protease [Metabacillus herbersteinensis]|uniref:S1C family serine protease n=1 Tax=Metabacillus herbersteinensis TaxID=283816 RepID=A0ABV6GMM0_9BACI